MEYEDRITIATPEGVDLELTLAGVGSRFTAAIVDAAIQFGLLFALALLLLGPGAFAGGDVRGGIPAAIFFVASFLLFFGYDILFEVLAYGRTPGKRWNGLRVVRTGGHPVTFLTSAVRNFLRLVDWLPALYVVGMIAILVTARNQRLGDIAAGTLVIRDRLGGARKRDAWKRRPAAPPAPDVAAAWDVSAITTEELAAVRRFLERREELEWGARLELASTLAERLRPKVAGAPDDAAPEAFLEYLAAVKAART